MIDWPKWAHYHAYDSDGRGWYYKAKPILDEFLWWPGEKEGGAGDSGYTMPAGMDWKQSLIKRPWRVRA